LSRRARRYPEIVAEIVAEGHAIGIHADIHAPLDRQRGSLLIQRLSAARAELEQLAQTPVRDHRPPYGRTSRQSLLATRRAGLRLVMWSHDPRDWSFPEPEPLSQRISRCLLPGAVISLHDGSGEFPRQGRATAIAIQEVLPVARDLALEPVALTDVPTT
jgi:peptidoglycan/xylan/chitin deacetylase (PgdA/CDA1 family)